MPELCKTHNLALAPNGKCVLCLRPKPSVFGVREEAEELVSKIFTWLLFAGLLGALVALLHVSRLDQAEARARYADAPGLGRADGTAPTLRADEASADQDESVVEPGDPQAAAIRARAGTAAATSGPAPKVSPKAARSAPRSQLANGKLVATLPTAGPVVEVAVTMYTAPWCYICDRSRDFLLARNVVLRERDIELQPGAARRLKKVNPGMSIPTFEIQGRQYVGFNAWDLEDALRGAAQQQHFAASLP